MANNPYTVGVSTGIFSVAKSRDLAGLERKSAGFGAFLGVPFVQIDIDSTTEFLEPNIAERVKKSCETLGLRIGVHVEDGFGLIESAKKVRWEQAHKNFVKSIHGINEINADYLLLHLSYGPPLSAEASSSRISGGAEEVVNPDAKPFTEWGDNEKVKEFLGRNQAKRYRTEVLLNNKLTEKALENTVEVAKNIKAPEDAEDELKDDIEEFKKRLEKLDVTDEHDLEVLERMIKRIPDLENVLLQEKKSIKNKYEKKPAEKNEFKKKIDKELAFEIYENWAEGEAGRPVEVDKISPYLLENSEIAAYIATAIYLKENNHGLWKRILNNHKKEVEFDNVGDVDPQDLYINHEDVFNAIVSAYYVMGHLNYKPKKGQLLHPEHRDYLGEKSILEYAKDNNLNIILETPIPNQGFSSRLVHPIDAVVLIEEIGKPETVQLSLDFEHLLVNGINPPDAIDDMPDGSGKYVKVMHLGAPKAVHPSHVPLELGSEDQEIIYDWLYKLRKKGMKDGYLIFERGGGQHNQETYGSSVLALRKIAEYLKEGKHPDKLPDDFFGKTPQELERQRVTIKEHALDPLKDFLQIPDDKFTFIGKKAVEKGKAEQWEKGKYK